MMPVSRPCRIRSRSRRCSPMQIRLVTMNTMIGTTITESRNTRVSWALESENQSAMMSLAAAIQSTP